MAGDPWGEIVEAYLSTWKDRHPPRRLSHCQAKAALKPLRFCRYGYIEYHRLVYSRSSAVMN